MKRIASMKRIAMIVSCMLACLSGIGYGADQSLSIEQLRTLAPTAPTYLYKDKDGRPYALQLAYEPQINPEQPHRPWKGFLGDQHFAFLAEIGADIRYLPDFDNDSPDIDIGQRSLLKADKNNCMNATLPTDFNITYGGTGGSDMVYGNVGWCNPNGRPSGKHTQWVGLQVFSNNYSGQGAHTPVVSWFKSTLHGMGMIFGDTHTDACTNGQASYYNTRIEAWSTWQGYGPGQPLHDHDHWTSSGTTMHETCGLPWQDAWILPFNPSIVYSAVIQSSDSQWTQYSVLRDTGSGFQPFVSAIVRNVNFTSIPLTWPPAVPGGPSLGPGVFDATANGVYVGSSAVAGSGSWIVGIRALSTGWF
jgi:hypothetical protein